MPHYAILAKRASQQSIALGDTVTYTIDIENTNEHPLVDVMFHDQVPNGLMFQPDSVRINNTPRGGYNPNTGFPLNLIPPHDSVTVSFIATAVAVPTDNPVVNIADIRFDTTDPSGDPVNGATEESNPVTVRILPEGCNEDACAQNICKIYSVSLPVTVRPFARREETEIICFGELETHEGHRPCPDPRREFEYTFIQRIRVEIPVAFGAEVCCDEPCAEDDGQCPA